MAVTNMWAVKGRVSDVIRYIENPEKTTARDMEDVISYISDADKYYHITAQITKLFERFWGFFS